MWEKLCDKENIHNPRDRVLVQRAYTTLMNNIYPSNGEFLWSPYRCISPGKNGFPGVWNWDTAFHAVGVSRWDTELAKENIIGFFEFQKENGMLPDVIFESGKRVDTLSKPPVFAWATEVVYKRDRELAFLKQMYPKLVLNTEWWEKERCSEGLFRYDASEPESEDYLKRVKWESGWDNSPRWDRGITKYWAIDLNCFMVMCYNSLSFISKELCLDAEAEKWLEKSHRLALLINQKMWSEKGYYSDTDRFTGEISSVLSPASFMPLYVGIASPKQAECMSLIAEDKNKFDCKMPTVSFDNPGFDNDYWRGPTWLNVAYFAAKGLKNYGFDVADKIKESILEICHNEKKAIFENYNSRTGEGQGCAGFSWSSVFIMEFIFDF
ncbi:MAG: hypothetical protein IKD04_08010 [Clostridia bacterium]|nr:hypothetical protein [Clostridia bacterium]